MDSYLFLYAEQLPEKWSEIELLISKAKENEEEDSAFHAALCRSITVLMVAQLEAFTKTMLRSVINDLNKNVSFEQLKTPIKRTYCKKYIPFSEGMDNKRYNKRIDKLIEKFDEVNCSIAHEPFYTSQNKNPSPYLLKTVYENLGIKDVFYCLNKSVYDDVFSSSKSELTDILIELRNQVSIESKVFPYSFVDNQSNLNISKINGKTLWEEFIERINQRRHSVAHGNESENVVSINELETNKLKIQIFELISLRILMKYILT